MPERNDPCTCGSGKKYKKCCGLKTAVPAPDIMSVNRAVAYKGEIGRRRKSYCEAYAKAKKQGIADVEKQLREGAAETGKTITCRKGCGYCCQVYVFADLQECDAIVHYLYEHEEALQGFLERYPRWKERINSLGRTLPRIEKAQEKVLYGTATDDDRRVFHEGLDTYAAMLNPCPFLKDVACTIYEVRPFVCAGVVSTQPPEYCAPGHPQHPSSMLLKADFQPHNDAPYFVKTKYEINFGCMPELVYQILKYGYSFLSTIGGLEDIRLMAANDPEVKETLRAMGVVAK
jgi:Fe-S-cluster containining protein